jgi:MFS family permease
MPRPELGALREREFRLLFLASTVTRLGSAMAPIALAFGVLNLTGSVSDLGFVLAAGSVPFVAFVLVGGVWADRISRLRVMAATGAVATVSQAVTAVLFLGGSARVWELMVLAALQGTARAFGGPAMGALIPDTISPARLQQATALLYMSASTVNIGGAAAGGLLVAAIGPGWTMLFNAATSLAEVAIRYLMRVDESAHAAGERRPFRHDFGEGWQAVTSRKWLWVMLLAAAGFALAVTSPWDVLGPALAKRSLGGPSAWGFIESGYGLGALVGGALVLRLRASRPLLTATVLNLFFIPALATFALASPVVLIIVAAFVGGAANDAYLVLFDTTVQRLVPRAVLARVISFDWFSDAATKPLGLAVVGPLAARIGMSAVFWAAAIGAIAVTVATVIVREVRTLSADAEPPP